MSGRAVQARMDAVAGMSPIWGAGAMSAETEIGPASEAAILSRLIRPEDESLSPEAAAALLRIRFDQGDLDRMHDLTSRNQEDRLGPAERAELESYRRVSYLLDLMHSKARRSLKPRPEGR